MSYAAFTPLFDRVMLKRLDEHAEDGSIIVAKKYRQESRKGVVIAVGDTYTLKPGDIVLFGEYNAEKFEKDGEEFLLVRLADIRGVERLV